MAGPNAPGVLSVSHRIRAAVAVGVVGALVSACGGVADQPSASPTVAAGAASGCASTLNVGAPYPLSGGLAEFGKNSLQGMQEAVDEINAAGGIKALNGAKLKVVPADTGSSDASQAATVTTKLITDDKVIAIVGAWLSNLTITASTSAEEGRVPMLTQSWADQITGRGYHYIFQPPPRSSAFGDFTVQGYLGAAKAAGIPVTRVAAVGPNDVANVGQITAAVKAFRTAGVTAGDPDFYQAGLTDASAIANRIADQKPDLVLASGSPSDAVLIVKAIRARGVKAPIVGFGGGFVAISLGQALGSAVDGIIAASAWNDDLPLPNVSATSTAYMKKFSAPFMPMEAGESWVAVYVLKDAMEKAATCVPQKIRDTLAGIDVTSGPGSSMPGGKVSFDATGNNPNVTPILIEWEGGRPVTIWPSKYAKAPLK